MNNKTEPTIGEIEAQLARENALRGNAGTVLHRYKRARARLAYLRIAAADPATLMGGRLPPSDDAEMNALTPSQLTQCAEQAMAYLKSLIPAKAD